MQRLILRLTESGTTVLMTTHYMDEAELCDTLGFIYEGKAHCPFVDKDRKGRLREQLKAV